MITIHTGTPSQTVGVMMPTPDLQQQFEEWWRPEYSDGFWPHTTVGDYGTIDHNIPASPTSAPKLCTLHWPTDIRKCATFFALVTDTELATIATWNSDSALYVRIDDGATWIQAKMRRLAARPVFSVGDTDQLYLMPLVDIRWSWNQLRNPVDDSVVLGTPTWRELIEAFSEVYGNGVLDTTGSTIDADYLAPEPSRWNDSYGYSRTAKTFPEYVAAVEASILCRTMPTGVLSYGVSGSNSATYFYTSDSKILVQNAGDARDVADANWDDWKEYASTGGLTPLTQLGLSLPSKVRVFFPIVQEAFEVELSGLSIPDTTGLSAKVTNAFAHIEAIPLDQSLTFTEREDFATVAATDWYLWRIADRVDVSFTGIVPWQPSGAEAAVEWSASMDPLNISTRVVTRAASGMQTLRTFRSSGGSGRVKVDDGASGANTVAVANGDGSYTGYIQVNNGDGSWSDGDEVRVSLMPSGGGECFVNERVYTCELNGTVTDGDTFQRYFNNGNLAVVVEVCNPEDPETPLYNLWLIGESSTVIEGVDPDALPGGL